MSKTIRTLIACILCMFSSEFYAQNNNKYGEDKMSTSYASDINKIIQIEFLSSEQNKTFALTSDIIKKIDLLQNADKVAYLSISPGCRVKIFPLEMTNQKDFKIKEEYVIVNQFEN